MKKSPVTKTLIFSFLSLFTIFAYAQRDKVIQVFQNGEVIQEFVASEIDYIEVNDLIPTPENVNATVSSKEITITWNAVENASYNVYRSADNVNFTLLASELKETGYTDKTPLCGTNYYRVSAVINNTESKYTQPVAANFTQSELPSGIYLGIYGFSKGLQTYPIEHLSEDNASAYHSFIDGLSATESFTWLYYAVDKSVDKLQETQFPADLSKVAVVTFTDGLDIGSLDEKDKDEPGKYLTNSDYRDALHTRLNNEKVSDNKIAAYTIGIIEGKGASLTTFRNNMNSLATSSANVFEVSDINNLNQIFQEIANSLSETNYVQKFVLSISGQSHNEKCKFTFDNVTSHSSSRLYIEGIYDRQKKALTNIVYGGLTSSSGTTVMGVYNESDGKYDFTFEDLQAIDGKLIPTDHVNHWFTDEGVWQDVDDEFFFNPDDATVQKIKRSAAIMLNLDCSKSMNGTKFAKLQEAAHSFVKTLVDNSIDPSEVSSVSLDKTSLSLQVGGTATLKATVLPATAKLKTVIWSSSDEAVATVDENGRVTAHSLGSATITVTTKDGGFTASCEINVISLVESISLNHTSLNLNVGETATLTAQVLPENATNKNIVWKSSNSTILTVDQTGLITAIAPGQATITASAADKSNVSTSCSVTVNQPLKGISLSSSSLTIEKGKNATITIIPTPANASNTDYAVSSSDTGIATASVDGNIITVNAVSFGSATITVKSVDGNYTSTATISVIPSTTPSHLALSIKKSGVRYFIPLAEYTGSIPTGYTKEGLTISYGGYFILSFNNATSTKKTFKDAQNYGKLPTQAQANAISSNWSSINNALLKYGGSSLGSLTYWTNYSRGTNGQGYYYSSSSVSFASSTSETHYVRCLIATL